MASQADLSPSSPSSETINDSKILLETRPEFIDSNLLKSRARLPYYQTLAYCLCYVCLGLSNGAIGPTLDLISANTNTPIASLGTIFTARALGSLVGSIAVAFLLRIIKGHVLLYVSILVLSTLFALIPVAKEFWLLLFIIFIAGFFGAFVDVSCNTLLFMVWKENVEPKMQFLHFSFGVGTSISPFIIALIRQLAPIGYELNFSFWVTAILMGITTIFPFKVASPPIEKKQSTESKHLDVSKQKKRKSSLLFNSCHYIHFFIDLCWM